MLPLKLQIFYEQRRAALRRTWGARSVTPDTQRALRTGLRAHPEARASRSGVFARLAARTLRLPALHPAGKCVVPAAEITNRVVGGPLPAISDPCHEHEAGLHQDYSKIVGYRIYVKS